MHRNFNEASLAALHRIGNSDMVLPTSSACNRFTFVLKQTLVGTGLFKILNNRNIRISSKATLVLQRAMA